MQQSEYNTSVQYVLSTKCFIEINRSSFLISWNKFAIIQIVGTIGNNNRHQICYYGIKFTIDSVLLRHT